MTCTSSPSACLPRRTHSTETGDSALRTYVHLMDDGLGDAELLDQAVRSGNGVATQDPQAPNKAGTVETVEVAL